MKVQFDDKGKFYTEVVRKEALPATIQTRTHRVMGHIYVRQAQRVKDALQESQGYLAVTEATVFDDQGQVLYYCDFLAVNQDHIVWVFLDNESHPVEGSVE